MVSSDLYSAFMMDHAAGALPPALRLAGDLHERLSGEGAEVAADWAVVGGALLEGFCDAERRLAKPARAAAPAAVTASDILGADLDKVRWRKSLFGVAYAPAGLPGGRFVRLEDNQSAPAHGHGCLEAMVVLEGRFEDGRGRYELGDLALTDNGVQHAPRAVGGRCICYVGRAGSRFWIM